MRTQSHSSESHAQTARPVEGSAGSPERLLLTVEAPAFRCSVSRSTMYALVGAGLIRSIVVGARSRRVVASDLERWIAEQASQTESLPRG